MLGKLIFCLKFLKIFRFSTTSITSIYSKALTGCPFFTLSLTILKIIFLLRSDCSVSRHSGYKHCSKRNRINDKLWIHNVNVLHMEARKASIHF